RPNEWHGEGRGHSREQRTPGSSGHDFLHSRCVPLYHPSSAGTTIPQRVESLPRRFASRSMKLKRSPRWYYDSFTRMCAKPVQSEGNVDQKTDCDVIARSGKRTAAPRLGFAADEIDTPMAQRRWLPREPGRPCG